MEHVPDQRTYLLVPSPEPFRKDLASFDNRAARWAGRACRGANSKADGMVPETTVGADLKTHPGDNTGDEPAEWYDHKANGAIGSRKALDDGLV